MNAATPRRSRLAVAICLVTALYWLTIFGLTHAPVVPVPHFAPRAIDKIAHLGVFAVLAFLLCAAGTSLGYSSRRVIAAVILIVAAYGVFDEFTQQFVPNRFSDVRDWMADMLGAGIGITAFAIARELFLSVQRRLTAT